MFSLDLPTMLKDGSARPEPPPEPPPRLALAGDAGADD